MNIFISAASQEYGEQRRQLAEKLRRLHYTVFEQADLDTSGTGLLHRLKRDILASSVVVAILDAAGGGWYPSEEADDFRRVMQDQKFEKATYTQWEIFFARYYGKDIVPIGLKSLFQPGATITDHTQAQIVETFVNEGRYFECESAKDLADEAALKVLDILKRQMSGSVLKSQFPAIADHTSKLHSFSEYWLKEAAQTQVHQQDNPRDWFASRPAYENDDKSNQRHVPEDLIRDAEAFARQVADIPQTLIVGNAGDGKTTLIYELLHHFTDAALIPHYKIVPIFANCLTLSAYLGQKSADGKALTDREAVENWLRVAISPVAASSLPGEGRDPTSPKVTNKVETFLNQVRDAGFMLLILVDGIDELDPEGNKTTSSDLARRLFRELDDWIDEQQSIPCRYIATTRPFDGEKSIAAQRRMVRLTLQPPTDDDLLPIVRKLLELPKERDSEERRKTIHRFLAEFRDKKEINGALFYLQPLARYYREYRDEAERHPATRQHLMEIETNSIVRGIRQDLPQLEDSHEAEIRHVLLEIAVNSLQPHDPDVPSRHTRGKLAQLASVEAVPGLADLLKNGRIVRKLMHVLIYVNRSGDVEHTNFHYRLPHNEQRDYLIAEGIFSWIHDGNPLAGKSAFREELASAYLGAARVKQFMNDIIEKRCGLTNDQRRRAFARSLIHLMNDREAFPHGTPLEDRTKASPHGAMLSLLLSLGDIDPFPRVKARGVCFQRTMAPLPLAGRIRLPLETDCTESIFRESNLQGVDLSDLIFDQADFDNADLKGANLARSSFVAANLRNVAMGEFRWKVQRKDFEETKSAPTVLTKTNLERCDLFNYRFHGLKGYYYFWDLEVAGDDSDPERYVLAAGSRGQILAFDLQADALEPITIQSNPQAKSSQHDEILDLSRHPDHRDLIVITGRDCNVRVLKLPAGDPSTWISRQNAEGLSFVELPEVANPLSMIFDEKDRSKYPRRAQFSSSGMWLAVIARDERVAFYRVNISGDRMQLDGRIFGREHTGAVMCVVADEEPTLNTSVRPHDRFFTTGYDGRLAVWVEADNEECWKRPIVESAAPKTVGDGTKIEIFRALVPSADGKGFWAGSELGRALHFYAFRSDGTLWEQAHRQFPAGVFALALHDKRLAVGLANGRVMVFAAKQDDDYDWENPLLDGTTNSEIVRSLQFIHQGRQLLAATWDACLFRFDVDRKQEISRFEYPQSLWQPERDIKQIEFDENPLANAVGISERMSDYLLQVQRTRQSS